MNKREVIAGPSCLTAAADDEPVFVLRANDELAALMIDTWASYYKARKQQLGEWGDKQQAKYYKALLDAQDMRAWLAGQGRRPYP